MLNKIYLLEHKSNAIVDSRAAFSKKRLAVFEMRSRLSAIHQPLTASVIAKGWNKDDVINLFDTDDIYDFLQDCHPDRLTYRIGSNPEISSFTIHELYVDGGKA